MIYLHILTTIICWGTAIVCLFIFEKHNKRRIDFLKTINERDFSFFIRKIAELECRIIKLEKGENNDNS